LYKMIQRVTKISGLLMVFAVSTTWAQDTVRVRGTIERVEGQTLLVKSRDGAELKVVLADNALVVGIAGVTFGHQAGHVRGHHWDAAA
jgi:hypothetical protein